jgi:hypothetical protein
MKPITKAQARTLFNAIVDSRGELPIRMDMRLFKALALTDLTEWRDVPLSDGQVGGARFVTQEGYKAAREFYRNSPRASEIDAAWSHLEAAGRAGG